MVVEARRETAGSAESLGSVQRCHPQGHYWQGLSSVELPEWRRQIGELIATGEVTACRACGTFRIVERESVALFYPSIHDRQAVRLALANLTR